MAYKTFSPVVCERLRRLVAAERDARSKREDLFSDRDDIKDKLGRLHAQELLTDSVGVPLERSTLLAQLGQAVLDIESYDRVIKGIQSEKNRVIEKADQAELFPDAEVPIAQWSAPPVKPPRRASAGTEGDSSTPPATRPVVGGTDGSRLRSPFEASGQDQHLEASVHELDVSGEVHAALIRARFDTVGAVAAAEDAGESLSDLTGLGDVDVARVRGALKAYRTVHRSAAVEAGKKLEVVG